MNDHHAAPLRDLFDAVVDLPPAEREAALRAKTTSETLVREVLDLCAASDATPTGRLHTARDAMLRSLTAPTLAVGETLGAWRIMGEIGRGGMGVVYRVERSDGHYTQTAALKFVAGAPGSEPLQRFGRERQTLAQLSHPHIARLLDGGASADGRPFLVMEYIDGMHLDRWCRERRLDTRQIIKLFLDVCDAVAFAHRQLIVHCDIKPSNVLVDAEGRVVLLDFGVAQLVDRLGDADGARDESAVGFTPDFASPEQLAGAAVSTATDVYGLARVLKIIVAHATDQPVAPEVAAIIARASADDPRARYGTAEALANDLRRFLAREPVQAIGDSRWYRARCFLRRHALPVTLAAGLLLTLAAGLATTLLALDDAKVARARAERTAEFLGSVLSAVDPNRARELDKTLLREVLDRAAEKANKELANEPSVLGQVENVIGQTYYRLGEQGTALEHLSRALELMPAEALRERLRLRAQIANTKDALNRRQEALGDLEAVAQEFQANFAADDPDALRARALLADQYARLGDFKRALAMSEALQPILEAKLGPNHDTTLANLRGLAIALGESGNFEASERTYLRVIERRTATLGADNTLTIGTSSGLAIAYLQNKQFEKAQALLTSLYPRAVKRLGERSVQTINIASLLGSALRQGGKLAESEKWYRFALDQSYALYGEGHSATLFYEQNFAHFEVAAGRPLDALQRLDRIEPLLIKFNGPKAPVLADVYRARGRALTALGRLDEAREVLNVALTQDRERFGKDDHPAVREDLEALAAVDQPRKTE